MKRSLIPLFSLVLLNCLPASSQEELPTLAKSDGEILVPEAPGESAGNPTAAAKTAKFDLLARAEVVIEKIRTNNRIVDPFGMSMDPTNMVENAAFAEQYQDVEEAPVITNSALKNALQTLPITGVYPSRHMIVLGARSFQRGDIFGMKLEELTIRLRFEGVKGESVYFKDLDTQEVATVEFNTRPAEFEPITSNQSRPPGKGIVPMDDLYIVN